MGSQNRCKSGQAGRAGWAVFTLAHIRPACESSYCQAVRIAQPTLRAQWPGHHSSPSLADGGGACLGRPGVTPFSGPFVRCTARKRKKKQHHRTARTAATTQPHRTTAPHENAGTARTAPHEPHPPTGTAPPHRTSTATARPPEPPHDRTARTAPTPWPRTTAPHEEHRTKGLESGVAPGGEGTFKVRFF